MSDPFCEVHLLSWNEERILPWSLRHFATFCDRMVVHDAFSTDNSRAICAEYGAEVVDWHCPKLDDLNAKSVKERAVMESKAAWCIPVDADELIYFPHGAAQTLAAYDAAEIAVVKPRGFELFSDTPPSGEGQIYDYIKDGCPEQKWYSKSVLVAPHRIQSITFAAGAHETWATLKNGRKIHSKEDTPITQPETWFLHARHIWGLDASAERYKRQQQRHSVTNKKHKFGSFSPPRDHALEKRQMILAGLQRVIE